MYLELKWPDTQHRSIIIYKQECLLSEENEERLAAALCVIWRLLKKQNLGSNKEMLSKTLHKKYPACPVY